MREKVIAEESLDDKSLIRQILAGNIDMFSCLVQRYQNQVYAMIRRRVRDLDVSGDLTQETFAKAYLGLKSYRQESEFSTWLIRIALNVSNSYFTSRRYKEQLKSVPLEVYNYTNLTRLTECNADEQYSERALHKLQISISKLKPKSRDVISLCCLEKMTHKEAAKILDVAETTITSRMHTAMCELRKSYRSLK